MLCVIRIKEKQFPSNFDRYKDDGLFCELQTQRLLQLIAYM